VLLQTLSSAHIIFLLFAAMRDQDSRLCPERQGKIQKGHDYVEFLWEFDIEVLDSFPTVSIILRKP
jgi:hypothetical protein